MEAASETSAFEAGVSTLGEIADHSFVGCKRPEAGSGGCDRAEKLPSFPAGEHEEDGEDDSADDAGGNERVIPKRWRENKDSVFAIEATDERGFES